MPQKWARGPVPIYLMFAVQISIPYQYTSFWGSDIPIYLMFSENSSNIPIYRMHDLGAQKGHTNIPHVFEKWPNIPIYLNLKRVPGNYYKPIAISVFTLHNMRAVHE